MLSLCQTWEKTLFFKVLINVKTVLLVKLSVFWCTWITLSASQESNMVTSYWLIWSIHSKLIHLHILWITHTYNCHSAGQLVFLNLRWLSVLFALWWAGDLSVVSAFTCGKMQSTEALRTSFPHRPWIKQDTLRRWMDGSRQEIIYDHYRSKNILSVFCVSAKD